PLRAPGGGRQARGAARARPLRRAPRRAARRPRLRHRGALAALNVVLCSANPGKLREMQEALPAWSIEALDATDYPVENGETYLDNARAKARFGREVGPRDRWMLADDSGIELAALGGAPGVQTARWAEGRHVEKTLAALAAQADRRARYVAELVLLAP